jgi:hypothetical protein
VPSARDLLRGRPRKELPLHLVINRELTAAMRQLRVAVGDDTAHTIELLNTAITDLYPQARPGRTEYGRTSEPHLVDKRYVLALERGHHSQLPPPGWLANRAIGDKTLTYGSRVPPWLVRAYDHAFGADGYLVDMFVWATAALADHDHDLPRLTRNLPEHIPVGREYEYLAEPLVSAGGELEPHVHALLLEEAGRARPRLAAPPIEAGDWEPSVEDASGNLGEAEEEMPEGIVLAGESQFVARWVIHNIGRVPWRDRWLFRVGQGPAESSLASPHLITIPDTDPGGSVELRLPVRAPRRPGTYRACVKMGWPNGVYCFPSTLLGLIVTVIVPPDDLESAAVDWPVR